MTDPTPKCDTPDCVLPAGHHETLHEAPDGTFWFDPGDPGPSAPCDNPMCACDANDPPHEAALPAPSVDLRDQIADALMEHAHQERRKKEVKRSRFLETVMRAGAEARADAVLPVVEAALEQAAQQHLADTADRRVEITTALGLRLPREWDDVLTAARRATERAEQAEAALQRVRGVAAEPRNSHGLIRGYVMAADVRAALDTPKETR